MDRGVLQERSAVCLYDLDLLVNGGGRWKYARLRRVCVVFGDIPWEQLMLISRQICPIGIEPEIQSTQKMFVCGCEKFLPALA